MRCVIRYPYTCYYSLDGQLCCFYFQDGDNWNFVGFDGIRRTFARMDQGNLENYCVAFLENFPNTRTVLIEKHKILENELNAGLKLGIL